MVVGRLQQRAWTVEDGSARPPSSSWPRSWAEPAMGDRHAGQGHQQRQRLHPVIDSLSEALDEHVAGLGQGHRRPVVIALHPGPHDRPVIPVDIPQSLVESPGVGVVDADGQDEPNWRVVASAAGIRAVPIPWPHSGPITSRWPRSGTPGRCRRISRWSAVAPCQLDGRRTGRNSHDPSRTESSKES
jgi:hypothetical protein